MKQIDRILIIIPVFNEEENIMEVVDEIHSTNPNWDIIAVNDCSVDRSKDIIESINYVRLINLPNNLGIGGAVQTGFKYAVSINYDYCVQVDGDGQHPIDRINDLIDEIGRDKYDVVIGSRFTERKNGYKTTNLRRVGIKIFEWTSILLINQKITDHTSGFRAYNKNAFTFLAKHYPSDYPEPEVVVFLGKNGFKMKEIFVQMFKRNGGVSSISLLRAPYYMVKVLLSMFMASFRSRIK